VNHGVESILGSLCGTFGVFQMRHFGPLISS
jgi:hypothetical protein